MKFSEALRRGRGMTFSRLIQAQSGTQKYALMCNALKAWDFIISNLDILMDEEGVSMNGYGYSFTLDAPIVQKDIYLPPDEEDRKKVLELLAQIDEIEKKSKEKEVNTMLAS